MPAAVCDALALECRTRSMRQRRPALTREVDSPCAREIRWPQFNAMAAAAG